ncbi:MAG TPA: hypothetical protein VK276_09430 [Rubrobacteraceae bacterium]|jgi:hypothetical protein|nr:hypothetical protein [Rubrobacteraceae bacterium]
MMMEETVGSAKGDKEALPAAQLTGESVLGAAHEGLTAPEVLALALVVPLALVALSSALLVLAII